MLLLPLAVMAQQPEPSQNAHILAPASSVASGFRQVTFENLGAPSDNNVRWVTNGTAGSPCTGSGSGAYAFRVGSIWNCTTGAPGGGGGGGSVSSVGLSVPAPFSVSGTPITTSGTLALSWATGQAANRFLASPNGTSGPVGLRAIVPADFITGSVTVSRCLHTNSSGLVEVAAGDCGVAGGSVSSFSAGALAPLFTTSVSTATTTPALSFALNTQAANVIFAGPTTGSAAAPTFRVLVAADIPAITESKFSFTDITTANATASLHGLLPKLSGSLSDCFRGNGTYVACASGTTSPGGSTTQIQFNNSSAFGGASNFLYNSVTGQVTANQGANGNTIFYGKRTTDSGPTGNLILFQNQAANIDLFKVDVNGAMTLNSTTGLQDVLTVGNAVQLTTGTRPTCDVTYRGTMWYVAGGTGVADTIAICSKSGVDAYAWRAMATIP